MKSATGIFLVSLAAATSSLRNTRYTDPRNPFSVIKPPKGSPPPGGGCSAIFSCPECLAASGCGWCDSSPPSCQLEFQRDSACGGNTGWIGTEPAGQICPNRLFQGTATTLVRYFHRLSPIFYWILNRLLTHYFFFSIIFPETWNQSKRGRIWNPKTQCEILNTKIIILWEV